MFKSCADESSGKNIGFFRIESAKYLSDIKPKSAMNA